MQLLNSGAAQAQGQQQQQQPTASGGLGLGGMGMGMGGMQMHRATGSMGGAPMFGGGGAASGTMRPTPITTGAMGMGGANPMVPTAMRANTASPNQQQQQQKRTAGAGSAGGFDDLWNLSLASSGKAKPAGDGAQGKSMKDLQKEKATVGLWGGAGSSGARPPASGGFGNFGGGASGSGGGDDDLLL